MKRIILMAFAALVLAAPAANAQKINEEAIRAKLSKSDAEVANPKKAAKSATWINRGNVYFEAANEPTKELFSGAPGMIVETKYGTPEQVGEAELQGKKYVTKSFPYVTIYLDEAGKVFTWEVTRPIQADAIEVSTDSYRKALEIDPKSAPKVKEGLEAVVNYYLQDGVNDFTLGKYREAAAAYRKAFDIGFAEPLNKLDTALLFNSGYLSAMAGDFDLAAAALEEALKYDYESDGDIYYLLYHSYYKGGQEGSDVKKAKKALLDGVRKYPRNENILESLMNFYTIDDPEVGSPTEIIDIVNEAIKNDPDNAALWAGKGRIAYKLGNWEDAVEAFTKEAELNPTDYAAWFRLGYIYIEYGDFRQNELTQSSTTTNYEELEQEQERVNDIYDRSIAPLTKAHELNPTEEGPVEVLRQIYFRLRERDGYEAQYQKYADLLKKMRGEE